MTSANIPLRPRSSAAVRPEKITPAHLDRLAVVYVRQSTLQQVERNQESLGLQYGLRDRARDFGWADDRILVIDQDLGKSGATAEGRQGFQRLVSEVTLGHVGIVLGVEMSRLARSCRDFYQLIEACGLFGTLLADPDGVYDPGRYNDRLVLGLKGTMSEAELHVLKQRMTEGKLEKARRGELGMFLPRGYVRRPSGEIVKDPDEQVRHVVELVFAKFQEIGTLAGLLRYLVANGILLGQRIMAGPAKGDVEWVRPNRPSLQNLLTNPMYAGAYAYGKRQVVAKKKQPGRPGTGLVMQPREDWHVLLLDHHPAYITFEQYEANRARLSANRAVSGSSGVARSGGALFAGLLRCGKCGATMLVQYTGREAAPVYSCTRRKIEYGEPSCQQLSAKHLEPFLVGEVFRMLEPASLDLALRAAEDVEAEREHLHDLWKQRLERARYEAERAARQYRLAEPENRLVVRQLERDWEERLAAEQELTEEYERFRRDRPRLLTAEERDAVRRLAADVPALWYAKTTTNADRKEVLRAVLDHVVVDVEGTTEKVNLEIHWAGEHVVRTRTARPVASYEQLSYFGDLCERVRQLLGEGLRHREVAERLNAEGFRPPKRKARFDATEVTRLVERAELGGRGARGHSRRAKVRLAKHEWTILDLARKIGMPRITLMSWVRRGWVKGELRGSPRPVWVIHADGKEVARLRALREKSVGQRAHERWMAASDEQMSER